jgi:mono/diheme cytochrome c family protein
MVARVVLAIAAVAWASLTAWTAPHAASLQAPAAQSAGAAPSAVSPGPISDESRRVITQYCVACHNDRVRTAGLVLNTLDLANVPAEADVWEKVIRKLRAGAMPPAGMPRPPADAHAALVTWLEATLDYAAAVHPNPGRPALHRLNRAEYANAIRDLVAVEIDAEALLPPDDSIDGFDNNADILGVSPALLERYLTAAANISALAVGSPEIGPGSETYRVRGDASQTQHLEGLPIGTRGGLVVRHTFPLDGEYVFQVKLLETNLGALRGLEYPNDLEILVDGERVHVATVGGPEDYTGSPVNATDVVESVADRLRARVFVKAGPRQVGAAFVQKTHAQGGERLQPFLRSTLIATDHFGLPHVESFTILGPFDATGPGETPSRQRIFECRAATTEAEAPCARQIISTLVRRAYRRPPTGDEVDRLFGLYEMGHRAGGFERGIELALRAILANPKFVYRSEREPEHVAPGEPYPISDFELASRLSFFLWSSIPDDELLDLAGQNRLREQDVLDEQVRRMLADPRAAALVSNFAGQWLRLRNLKSAEPDKNTFPHFDDNLRRAFQREAELFIESIIREDRSALELLTADYTFVNERLARHYGIPNVYGSHFRRVTLPDDRRNGLLGKGAILLVTSHADRTSPVVRGQWILTNLLGTPPPPPPPDVDTSLAEDQSGEDPPSLRKRLELHRASPQCASCHQTMDPIGFAMENFDAVGAWRERDGSSPIDASGQLSDGTQVDGVVTLRSALLQRPDVFVVTMTEKLLTYALGRGLQPYDMPVVRAVVRDAAVENYRVSSIVKGIVHSVPFQMRTKGETQ